MAKQTIGTDVVSMPDEGEYLLHVIGVKHALSQFDANQHQLKLNVRMHLPDGTTPAFVRYLSYPKDGPIGPSHHITQFLAATLFGTTTLAQNAVVDDENPDIIGKKVFGTVRHFEYGEKSPKKGQKNWTFSAFRPYVETVSEAEVDTLRADFAALYPDADRDGLKKAWGELALDTINTDKPVKDLTTSEYQQMRSAIRATARAKNITLPSAQKQAQPA